MSPSTSFYSGDMRWTYSPHLTDEITDEEIDHARRVVCGYAKDLADATLLLTLLGLVGGPEEEAPDA